jgi:hypothetical protein
VDGFIGRFAKKLLLNKKLHYLYRRTGIYVRRFAILDKTSPSASPKIERLESLYSRGWCVADALSRVDMTQQVGMLSR